MGDAHGSCASPLRQQRTLALWAALPRRLEHFVGAERLTPVEQILRVGERFGRRELQVIGNPFDAFTAVGQRPAERVARAGAARPARVVTVASSCCAHSPRR